MAIKKRRKVHRLRRAKARPVTIYAQGKIQQAKKGQRAGDFGPAGSDFVVKPEHGGLRVVGADYRLNAGDTLTVTGRGVGGSGRLVHKDWAQLGEHELWTRYPEWTSSSQKKSE